MYSNEMAVLKSKHFTSWDVSFEVQNFTDRGNVRIGI